MFVTALLLGLVGVFCILDSRILGRMNFERPLITCTIVGVLLVICDRPDPCASID